MNKRILAALILVLAILVSGCVKTKNTGSINGKVYSQSKDVEVQVMQNKKWVASAKINKDGSYKISNLAPGKYGLLFIYGDDLYVYNRKFDDEYNYLWDQIESITVTAGRDASGNNINLDEEHYDFISGVLSIKFKSDTSIINRGGELIEFHNCTVLDKRSNRFRAKIPENKTLFEMREVFQSIPEVEFVTLLQRTRIDG